MAAQLSDNDPRRRLAAGVSIVAIVAIYLVVAAVAHAFPFAKPAHPIVQPTPQVTPIQVTPATTPVSTPATRMYSTVQITSEPRIPIGISRAGSRASCAAVDTASNPI